MSPDEPIELVPTEKARAALDQAYGVVQVGDVVKVGRGKHLWEVVDFWPLADGETEPIASLLPVNGYTNTSARVSRLTVVERPGVTS